MPLSLWDLLGQTERPEPATTLLSEPDPVRADVEGDPQQFALVMRKKRRAALLQQMLRAQGYDDLARMASVREQGV